MPATEKRSTPIARTDSRVALYVTAKGTELRKIEPEAKEDHDAIFAMANKFFDLNRYEDSRKLYDRIIQKSPDHPMAPFCYYNLGLINMKTLNWPASSAHFQTAYRTLAKKEDKKDALVLYLEALKKAASWETLLSEANTALNENPYQLDFGDEATQEISLRSAEAMVMMGKLEEGRRLAEYWITEIRRGLSREEQMFVPNLALAFYVLGKSQVYEFGSFKLTDAMETLVRKCQKIIDAQNQFLKAINVGVIFWTNAAAFEIAKLYMDLYTEMDAQPVPQELSDEEKHVYECEVWNKIANLLKKSRKTLTKSIDAAKRINEDNEYTAMSFSMVADIDRIYDAKESGCADIQGNRSR
ncbi:MAG TPA: tetratricopeptide repeat protein [bacterium]|nr:tetratricopeptide repeat protein [bacterium]